MSTTLTTTRRYLTTGQAVGKRVHRRAVKMVIPKYETEMRVTGVGAGAYAASGFGALGSVAGGVLGYQMPVFAYSAALFKSGHMIAGGLMAAAPFLAGVFGD